MVKLMVDGREIVTDRDETLLEACLENDIFVPNLCHLQGMEHPPASCRLCLVELDGESRPVPSCTLRVREGMVVRTDTPLVRRLQRTALRLLLSAHNVDCAHCPANKKCEIQRLASFLEVGLKPKGLEPALKEPQVDREHPSLDYYPNRCVLCGRCVHVCRREQGRPFLSFAHRGIRTAISFYGGADSSELPCTKCLACVSICPVGAITLKEDAPATLK
ncbi:MAG: (2Fe-2S)-binding protein [Deltaproteobacteria bacterium]|nr:(2Fe-2S)-binding protein [Deltaproteobacteria bacterium]MBW2136235.1 (2Fe-2S)-binding protein [Deltaproteobacteria bacterium]